LAELVFQRAELRGLDGYGIFCRVERNLVFVRPVALGLEALDCFLASLRTRFRFS
jgi:hypothetical protein